ncbi:MAG: LysE family transporter [Rhodobacteraceae bacterium]|nr:LysE family transporter [Paracoccaceae bacterium]
MSAAQLAAFVVTLAAAFVVPGPAMLLALRNTLTGGLAAGIATGTGLALVAAGWTGAALAGLGAVFALVPWAYGAMKLAGAAYLLWIAFQIWRDAGSPLGDSDRPARRRLTRAFASGLLVNLSNPKSVLFAAAVLVVIFPGGLGAADAALVVLTHGVLEILGYTLIALTLSRPAARAAYLRAKRWIDRIAGAVLAALGLRLLLTR